MGRDGSIDWFCPGRFDAPSLFCAILDADIGGSFRIAPEIPCSSKQIYLPETAVLLTRFFSAEGVAEVTDFMPVGLEPCAVVRRVDVVRGSVAFRMACRPGFDYARQDHRVTVDEPAHRPLHRRRRARHRARVEPAPLHRRPGRHGALPPRRRPARVVRPAAGRLRPALGGRAGVGVPRRDARVLAPLDGAVQLRRALARDGQPLGHHPEALHLRADGRDGGLAHLQPARGRRRPAQLGLPLRLAARLGLHGLRLPAPRLLRGGPRVRATGWRTAAARPTRTTPSCRSSTRSTAAAT